MVYCSNCGTQISAGVAFCPNCGSANAANSAPGQAAYGASTVGIKSRVSAGVLGILLGSFGVHKFYLGKVGTGLLYLLFCWTSIPGIIGLIEGIIYLTQTDQQFALAQGVRVA